MRMERVWPIGPHPASPDHHQGCLPTMPASFSACPHRAQPRSVQTEKGAEFAGGGGDVDCALEEDLPTRLQVQDP